jgi:hypothetical protein
VQGLVGSTSRNRQEGFGECFIQAMTPALLPPLSLTFGVDGVKLVKNGGGLSSPGSGLGLRVPQEMHCTGLDLGKGQQGHD